MNLRIILISAGIGLVTCTPGSRPTGKSNEKDHPMEITDLYTQPETEIVYSKAVSDSFKLFKSLPKGYADSALLYPLIIVLDANGYFEPVVSELKLATLTQDLPKCILVGIGYRGFWAMDSLRDRDLTYPVAPPEDEITVSGGAENFKKFIDQELLPKLTKAYRVDQSQIAIMGHSLGGYFVLYYLFDSLEKGEFKISNFIAASPSLHYHDRYILNLEKKLSASRDKLPVRLYVSVGSLEHDSTQTGNPFLDFKNQLEARHYKGAKLKLQEFGNFDHMDAAMPGFIKGLIFIFEK